MIKFVVAYGVSGDPHIGNHRMILEHDRLDQYDLGSVDYWYSAGDVLPVKVGKLLRREIRDEEKWMQEQ